MMLYIYTLAYIPAGCLQNIYLDSSYHFEHAIICSDNLVPIPFCMLVAGIMDLVSQSA